MANNACVEELISRFTAANNELIGLMEGCSDEQVAAMSEHEGRTVAVLARHIAVSHLGILSWVRALATGGELPELTMDMIHGVNAHQVEEWTEVDTRETIQLLRDNGEAVVSALRDLNDDHLDRSAAFSLYGGQEVTAQRVADDILVGHIQSHMASIREAIASTAAG